MSGHEEHVGLRVTDLHRQHAVGRKMVRRLLDQPFDDFRPADAADERGAWLVVSNLRRQLFPVRFADVREIRDDDVEPTKIAKQIAVAQFHPIYSRRVAGTAGTTCWSRASGPRRF